MAIELTEVVESNTLEVKASGKLTADDYKVLEPGVESFIKKQGKIKILFEMRDFHGWEIGAVWEDIKFATRHCTDISKIAMIGETSWEKWMSVICKPFTLSKIKYFDRGEVDAARAWLAE